jgi:hypothetical protein
MVYANGKAISSDICATEFTDYEIGMIVKGPALRIIPPASLGL